MSGGIPDSERDGGEYARGRGVEWRVGLFLAAVGLSISVGCPGVSVELPVPTNFTGTGDTSGFTSGTGGVEPDSADPLG